jgi:transcriptional regulator with XRE-family HTH domain
MANRKLSQETIDSIHELKQEGLKRQEIADRLGISCSCVAQNIYIKEHGIASTGMYQCLLQLNRKPYLPDMPRAPKPVTLHSKLKDGTLSRTEYRRIIANKNGYASKWLQNKETHEKNKKNPLLQKLAEVLNNAIKEKGLSYTQLGEMSGTFRKTIGDYCGARCYPKQDKLKKVFEALELPYTRLEDITGKDDLLE